ncbi:MAG: hypothetical protein AAF632_13335 [Bacteroidota bacterium]
MGYVKEPEGIDFIIESKPLTDEDRKQISQFIREYKRKGKTKKKGAFANMKKKNIVSDKVR